ncbi:MAG: UvrD-helicase domain-containing protein [Candidatus Brocadiaceae bacterium]|nr:UvrD-helicase domain-containing protein [Candidatus Brocadiaceae bacterium]
MPPSSARITAGLTESQKEAVCFGEGPLLVVAGAGSGKTRVITHRIAHLLGGGVAPENVVAVTFTNKAADEMRRRVEALVGRSVQVSTFHSFCALLLRRHATRLGRAEGFTIYDRADSMRVVRRVIKDLELDPATFSPTAVLNYISLHKDRVEGPEQCAQSALGYQDEGFVRAYRAYEARLVESNAMDFDDLLLKVLDLFRTCPDVLARYQDRYVHVLVDEYQDTNLPQHLIARALQGKHHNITAVGDPDQMIYTWRGARLENLMEFEEDFPGAQVVTLERNYRSSGCILKASSACIEFNIYRRPKQLWTEREDGARVLLGEFADSYAEGRWVARQVSDLIEGGTAPGDIAVFYRTKQQSLPVEDAFAGLSLPHQVVDSVGFFDRRPVKDITAYLRLIVNPRDDEACLRVINTPARGIGARSVERLMAAAAPRGVSLMEAVRDVGDCPGLSARARQAVGGFRELHRDLSALDETSMATLIGRLVARIEYLERQSAEERADTEETVDQLIGYAKQYDERAPEGGLMGFLEQAALVSDVDGWNAQAGAVPFMTLHSAKGLEFDAVFIVGVEEDVLPHRRALDDDQHGTEEAAVEEERRLFYVGMTRARHRLFLTHARTRTLRGRTEAAEPSRFLGELPGDCVELVEATPPTPAPAAAFAREMDYVLKDKKIALRILDGDGTRLARGARVSHPRFGEGMILSTESMGARHVVRVNFFNHGTMSLVLGPDEVGVG